MIIFLSCLIERHSVKGKLCKGAAVSRLYECPLIGSQVFHASGVGCGWPLLPAPHADRLRAVVMHFPATAYPALVSTSPRWFRVVTGM
jgi:hypothetical protein